LTSGSVPYHSASNLSGPVQSTPVAFVNVQVDGGPLSQFPGLYTFYWTSNGNSTGTTVAEVTPIYLGGNFAVLFNNP
jgi:hypothetical protein